MKTAESELMKRADTESELTLRIILEKPPAGVDFGLQKGRGRNYETIQKQTLQAQVLQTNDLHFEFTVELNPEATIPCRNFLALSYKVHPVGDSSTSISAPMQAKRIHLGVAG
jgi:Family of unknown function (DUF5990)